MSIPRQRIGAFGGALLLAIEGCARMLSPAPEPPTEQVFVPKQLKARQVIVTLAPAIPERWATLTQELKAQYRLEQVGDFHLSSLGIQCVVFQIPEDRSIAAILNQLAADPRVESVQPNQVFEGLFYHADQYAPLQYAAKLIRADKIHRLSTGKGVKVAVVDTGIDTGHPDLHDRITQTANFVEGGERTFTADIHGTAVAGVIAARADDVGIFGIAPQAEILAVKACSYPGRKVSTAQCSSWSLAKAVDFVINASAHVLNLSLAGPPDPLLARLLTTAHARGITIVAAVAEREKQLSFPASLELAIAVIASDERGKVPDLPAWTSDKPLLAAPGMEILTTVPRSAYDFVSGSSLAAAHVTGVVALLMERKRAISPSEVLDLLRTTARPRADSSAAIGVVDACAAFTELLGSSPC